MMDLGNSTIEEFTRERLMDDVRQYPCLYDKYSKDYQDKNAKNNAWAAVATKYGITALDAERKYKTIRSSFTRYLKRKRNAPPGSRNADGPTPIAFQNLDWLAGHIDHKEMAVKSWTPSMKNDGYFSEYFDNDEVYRGSYGELIREDGQSNGDVPLSSAGFGCVSPVSSESATHPSTTSAVVQQPSRDRPITSAITLYYDKAKHNETELGDNAVNDKPSNSHQAALLPTKRKRSTGVETDDEDYLFCMSLSANLKRLSPRSKAIAKMRFQQVLYEVEFPLTQSDEEK